MKRVLVAGSTGHLGGFVCRELKARGHFVRALARSPEELVPLRDSLDEIVEAEITRPETLEHVCDEIEVAFSSVGITRQKASGKKELVYYPEAEHCTVDCLDEVFPYIVDWLRRHLAGAEAGG